MSTPKRLHIGMSLAPTWLSGDAGGARQQHRRHSAAISPSTSPGAAHLDFVFRPDVSSLPLDAGDRLRLRQPGSHRTACRGRPRNLADRPGVDGLHHVPIRPTVARQPQSLHWISNGRAGWNIVTALQGHENFGLDAMPDAEQRARAPPSSPGWCTTCGTASPRGTPGRPRAAATPTFPGCARSTTTANSSRSRDRSTCRPSARRGFPWWPAPPRAGATSPPRWPTWCSRRLRTRRLPWNCAATFPPRRTPRSLARDVRLLPGFSLYLAESREEAREIFMQTHARLDRARKFATIRQMLGLDLSDWPLDRPISAADLPPPVANPGSRTHTDLLRRLIERETLRLDQLLLRPEVVSRRTGRSSVRWTMPSSRSSTGRRRRHGRFHRRAGRLGRLAAAVPRTGGAAPGGEGAVPRALQRHTFAGHLAEE